MTSISRQPFPPDALSALRECRSALMLARLRAKEAETVLPGARARRADELAEKIADAIAHCERLAFFVEGDQRAGQDASDRAAKRFKPRLGDACPPSA